MTRQTTKWAMGRGIMGKRMRPGYAGGLLEDQVTGVLFARIVCVALQMLALFYMGSFIHQSSFPDSILVAEN